MDLMDLPMWIKLEDALIIQISKERIWIIAEACLPTEWNTGHHLVRGFFLLVVKASLKTLTSTMKKNGHGLEHVRI